MTITLEQTKAELAKIVEEQGKDTIAECYYRDELGEPHCIVGHLVFRLFGEDALLQLPNGDDVHTLTDTFLEKFGFDYDAVLYLDRVQTRQDTEYCWGEAIEA